MLHEEILCSRECQFHGLALAFFLRVLLVLLAVLVFKWYVVLSGKLLDGLAVCQAVVLHDEMERVAALAATETLADVLGRRHAERCRLFAVERTSAHITGAGAFQFKAVWPQNVQNVQIMDGLNY